MVRCLDCIDAEFDSELSLRTHELLAHRPDQDLACPGCDTTYTSAASWMDHVEKGKCTGITMSALVGSRSVKRISDFEKGLEERDSPFKWEESPMQSNPWVEDFDNLKPHGGITVDQNYAKQGDFPRLPTQQVRAGDSKGLDLLTSDQPTLLAESSNAWSRGKPSPFQEASTQFPSLAALVGGENTKPVDTKRVGHALTPASMPVANLNDWSTALRKGLDGQAQEKGAVVDPDKPGFRVELFWNRYTGKYKCPLAGCGKNKFKLSTAFITHLRVCAQKFQFPIAEDLGCSYCDSTFAKRSGLLAHMEMSTKCHIRHDEEYGRLVGKLTANILRVVRPTAERAEDLGKDRPFAKLGLYRIVVDMAAFEDLVGPKQGSGEERQWEERW